MSRTLAPIVSGLLDMIDPLEKAFQSQNHFVLFVGQFGWKFDMVELPEDDGGIINLGASLGELYDSGRALVEELGDDDENNAQALADLVRVISDAFTFVEYLNALDLSALPEFLQVDEMWQTISEEIPDYLLIRYLNDHLPLVHTLLSFAGVIETTQFIPEDDNPRSRYTRYDFKWNYLSDLISDPENHLKAVYRWNGAAKPDDTGMGFNHPRLLNGIYDLLALTEAEVRMASVRGNMADTFFGTETVPPSTARELDLFLLRKFIALGGGGQAYVEMGGILLPVPSEPDAEIDGIYLTNLSEGGAEQEFSISDSTILSVSGAMDASGTVGMRIHPGRTEFLTLGDVPPDITANMTVTVQPADGTPWRLFGGNSGPRLELSGFRTGVGISGNATEPELIFTCATLPSASGGGLVLRIEPGDGDSFIKEICGNIDMSAELDLDMQWSSKTGLTVAGSGGLAAVIPINKTIGPIDLTEAEVSLGGEDGGVRLAATITGSASIGPATAVVEGIGFYLFASPADGQGTTIGPLRIDGGFQPPAGIGLEVDIGGIVSGGGFLAHENTEYRGALSLKMQTWGLTAFGILATELPDDEDGYSFLGSLFATFQIQLGYGFMLTGLGGVIGINRTSNIEPLRAALADGRLDNVMFPKDPIENATEILNDLAAVFPVKKGQYLFGPMLRLAWPTTETLEAAVGVIIEKGEDERLLILGSIGVMLPAKEAALVVIKVDFIGVIDFDIGLISFDGTLTNSRILTWPISGEMALRSGWGENKGFSAAIGGMHPQYPLPTDFPTLQRITINFGTNNPRLTLTAYQAVTLDSVQFGAGASLYAKGPDIPILGQVEVEGSISFDTLITFNPFTFDAQLALELKLLLNDETICAIDGRLQLSGPNTYHILGRLSVEVCRIEVSVSIDESWGERSNDASLQASAFTLLRDALSADDVCQPIMSDHLISGVSLNDDTDGTYVIDPTGGMSVSQKAIPLGTRIERVGNVAISDGLNQFDIELFDTDGAPLACEDNHGDFVTGQFFEISEAQKLSGNAFDQYKNGLILDSGTNPDIPSDGTSSCDYEYEIILIGEDDTASSLGRSRLSPGKINKALNLGIRKGNASLNPGYVPAALKNDAVSVAEDEYAVNIDTPDAENAPIVGKKRMALGEGRKFNNRIVRSYLTPPGP